MLDLLRQLLVGPSPNGCLGGIVLNISLALAGFTIAIPLASLFLFIASRGSRHLEILVSFCAKTIQATPLIVIILVTHYVLAPTTGYSVGPSSSALFAITAHAAGYQFYIFRSGLNLIDRFSLDYSIASGFGRVQIFRYVLVPQFVTAVDFQTRSLLVSLFKDSSAVYVIGLADLLQAGRHQVENQPDLLLPTYLLMGLLFFLVSLGGSSLLHLLGRRVCGGAGAARCRSGDLEVTP